MSNDLDTSASRDVDPEVQPWQYGAARRKAYWEQYGTTSPLAFFGPTNGPTSPWPGKAENFTPVWLPGSTIITTDGMSSPWSDQGGDPGEGLEYYIDSPRLRGASLGELQASWELALLMRVVSNYAGQDYRATFDHYQCLTLRIGEVDLPADWLDDEGNLCLLLGAPAKDRGDYVELFGDPQAVRLVAVTPLRPDELNWAVESGDRGVVGRVLAASAYGNQVHLDRPSLVEEFESAPPAPEPVGASDSVAPEPVGATQPVTPEPAAEPEGGPVPESVAPEPATPGPTPVSETVSAAPGSTAQAEPAPVAVPAEALGQPAEESAAVPGPGAEAGPPADAGATAVDPGEAAAAAYLAPPAVPGPTAQAEPAPVAVPAEALRQPAEESTPVPEPGAEAGPPADAGATAVDPGEAAAAAHLAPPAEPAAVSEPTAELAAEEPAPEPGAQYVPVPEPTAAPAPQAVAVSGSDARTAPVPEVRPAPAGQPPVEPMAGSPAAPEFIGRPAQAASAPESVTGAEPTAVPPAAAPAPAPAPDPAVVPESAAAPDAEAKTAPAPAASPPTPVPFPVPVENLPWDETWVESRIREDLLAEPSLAPIGAGSPVPEEYFERFAGVLPNSVLYIWRRLGFEGFGQGRTWITDPVAWAPVVEAWLDGVDLPFPDQTWWCLTRTALGGMSLWGEISGPALEVDPIGGVLRPHAVAADRMSSPIMRERMGALLLIDPMEEFYEDEATDRDLINAAVAQLGRVGPDQVYGFAASDHRAEPLEVSRLSVQIAVDYLPELARGAARTLEADASPYTAVRPEA